VSCRRIQKDNFKKFHLRGHLPQNLKSKVSQTGISLRAGYRSRDALQRYCLLHVVVQGPGSFQYLVNFSVRCMVAELRGVKVAQFPDFSLFFPYKTPKTYLPVTSLQPMGYITKWLLFFHVVVERGAFWPRRFPATSGRGAGDPKLAQIFTYGKWLYPYWI